MHYIPYIQRDTHFLAVFTERVETQKPTSDIPSLQVSWKKHQVPDLEEGRNRINPEHLGPESNEVLKKKQAYQDTRL